MSKWDKYRVNNEGIVDSSKWDKYKISKNLPSNTEIGTKAIASGLLSNLDIPQSLGTLVEEYGLNPEYGPYGQGRKLYNYLKGDKHEPLKGPQYLQKLTPNLASNTVKSGLKNYTNINLEPTPSNGTQKIIKHAGEFAGGLGPFGLLNKGGKAANVIKNSILGGTIGGISGVAQEGGVDPLVADIGTAVAIPLAPAISKNLLNKFTPSHRKINVQKRVANALKTQIGEENLPIVLENIQKYKRQKKPIQLNPTTAELAAASEIGENVGLSRLYRTQSNSNAIPIRYKENDIKLRDTLEKIGNTGLEESVKGETIRVPFFDKFNRKKARRTRLTEPLYEELENIQTGLATPNSKALLEKEINISSPDHKAPLEKYLKGLSRNDRSPVDIKKIAKLEKDLKLIDTNYKELGPHAIEKIKATLRNELEDLKSAISPRPIQIENTIQELGDKVNSFNRKGESNAARRYGNIKKAYEEDLRENPIGLKHREEYRRLSKPINEIETSSLLKNFVKENKDISKMEGFVVSSEKIPNLILKADLPNTKILINKAKGNKEILSAIKGAYIDELLKTSTVSSGNFSYNQANKFLNNKFNKEKIGVIFNNNEKKKMDYFLNTLEKRNKIETQGKMSGSDSHQKFKVEGSFAQSLRNLKEIAKEKSWDLTKWAANKVGGGIGKDATNAFVDLGKSLGINQYNTILEDALVNPNSFKKLMKNEYTKPKTFKDFYNPLPSLIGTTMAFRNKQQRSK